MNEQLAERVRYLCRTIRTKPFPLCDIIPLMQQVADALDAKDAEIARQLPVPPPPPKERK